MTEEGSQGTFIFIREWEERFESIDMFQVPQDGPLCVSVMIRRQRTSNSSVQRVQKLSKWMSKHPSLRHLLHGIVPFH